MFGHVDPINVPELSGEFAFVTGVISEGEYEEKAEKLGTVISRIRCPSSACMITTKRLSEK
ncbi:MAG: hypothetical protein ACLR6B_07565 [Blautia sp.]